MKKRSWGAFTLIEILVVAAIIAILAAIAVPNFLEAQTRSKVSRVQADMRTLATALETYAVDYNKYPPGNALHLPTAPVPALGWSVFNRGLLGQSSLLTSLTTPVAYISGVPRDPFVTGISAKGPPVDELTEDWGDMLSHFPQTFDTYRYQNSVTYANAVRESPCGGGDISDGSGRTSGALWHIVSAGPDKIMASGGGTVAMGDLLNNLGVDYDPTNGTVSAGDVVRIGGGPGQPGVSPEESTDETPVTLPANDRVQKRYNRLD